jgi:membrane fusion protein, multidrug efflux system
MKYRLVITNLALFSLLITMIGCSKKQAGAGFTPPPTPVEAALVQTSTVEDRFDAVGSIEAHDAVTIVSEIDAIVKELPFAEGTTIEKGALIAQLDDAQLLAQLARASAVRDQKLAAYNRVKSLFTTGAVAQQEYDDASASYKVAEADLAMITASLAKTKIVAPFTGEIGARQVSPGAFLRAGTAIADLAQISELKITFAAPERYFPLLHKGNEVTISTTSYPDYYLKGKIEVIEPNIDPSTRAVRMIAHFLNPDLKFRPGMSANVSAVLARRDQALLIPDEAVFAEGNQSLVFVINPDSTVTRKQITVGSRQRQTVEVVQGLESGMTVVKTGHQKIYDGARVIPIPSQINSEKISESSGGGA